MAVMNILYMVVEIEVLYTVADSVNCRVPKDCFCPIQWDGLEPQQDPVPHHKYLWMFLYVLSPHTPLPCSIYGVSTSLILETIGEQRSFYLCAAL